MLYLMPHNLHSKSAKLLAERLECKRIKREGKPIRKATHIVNWGCSSANRDISKCFVLNNLEAVALAVDKLKTFDKLGWLAPSYTTRKEVAQAWVDEGIPLYARTELRGHSGAGISYHKAGDKVVDAPLYVMALRIKNEYRVHVFLDKVIFVQRKARKLDVPDDEVNWKIRNHQNGFIYAHKDVEIPYIAELKAKAALLRLGLDFGAVDIVEDRDGYFTVLEVNTACGLEGTTLDKYAEAINEWRML